MKEYFILQIKDSDTYEGECIYKTLLYDNFEECNKAGHLVKELEKSWYNELYDEFIPFDEFIEQGLKQKNLYGNEVSFYTCWVR